MEVVNKKVVNKLLGIIYNATGDPIVVPVGSSSIKVFSCIFSCMKLTIAI